MGHMSIALQQAMDSLEHAHTSLAHSRQERTQLVTAALRALAHQRNHLLKVLEDSIQQDSLDDKFKNALELYRKIHNSMPPEFTGGKSHRHGKRLNSRKPRAFKNKTKTRRYRKRSFTRRRK